MGKYEKCQICIRIHWLTNRHPCVIRSRRIIAHHGTQGCIEGCAVGAMTEDDVEERIANCWIRLCYPKAICSCSCYCYKSFPVLEACGTALLTRVTCSRGREGNLPIMLETAEQAARPITKEKAKCLIPGQTDKLFDEGLRDRPPPQSC